MTPPLCRRVVVVGRDAALWLSVDVIHAALGGSGVEVSAIELPSRLTRADVYATLPPLEALHNQLGIDKAALLPKIEGVFTLGQNFVDTSKPEAAFLHAYGAYGTVIDGKHFFTYWLRARGLGLRIGLEDFSLTASAARQGRLLIPDDETEKFGPSEHAYHLPAAAYAHSLRGLAVHDGIAVHSAEAITIERNEAGLAAVIADGQRIEGDLFIDATGERLLVGALGMSRESWRRSFPADRILVASASKSTSIQPYAEIRAHAQGWTGVYPTQVQTHVVQPYTSNLCSDEEAIQAATTAAGLPLTDVAIRTLNPGMLRHAWTGNVVAIGASAAEFDPLHNLDLLGIQRELVQLLAFYPVGLDFSAQRTEFNRLVRASYERLRDFQALHYRINAYAGLFWAQAREGEKSPELAHRISLFQARGEVAPYEEESFAPDSWRAFFIGHGLLPDTYSPMIDGTSPDAVEAQFRAMLDFVKEKVLLQPTHDAYLQTLSRCRNG